MSDTEVQRYNAQLKSNTTIKMEELRHKHIMDEIKAMREAGITAFVRQVKYPTIRNNKNETPNPIKAN